MDLIGVESFEQTWEVQETAQYCVRRGFQRVALQFPDSLLEDSPKITELVQVAIDNMSKEAGLPGSCKLYLLADTSYNPECVDEVAAAHINAEAVIHYGQASMSPLSRLPARYVFGRRPLDTAGVAESLADVLATKAGQATYAVVFLEHALAHHSAEMQQRVSAILAHRPVPEKGAWPAIAFAELTGCEAEPASMGLASHGDESTKRCIAGLRWKLPSGAATAEEPGAAVWVGDPEAGTKAHLELTLNTMSWAAINVDHHGAKVEVSDGLPIAITRLLGRRYFLVEKARDASIVGLLVGTLGVAGYRHAISALRTLVESAGKACYIFLVGKPSPAKLANFPEIEVFVQVGDPQGLVLDSKEFYSPIVTPHEAFVAFSGRDWDPSKYRLDFQDLLQPSQETDSIPSEPRMSFMSGGISLLDALPGVGDSTAIRSGDRDTGSSAALCTAEPQSKAVIEMKSSGALKVASAAEYLAYRRTYTGLETPATGAEPKPVEKAVQGLSGRAAGYETEPSKK